MTYEIYLTDETGPKIYDKIRRSDGWVSCWHTDENGHTIRERESGMVIYPAHRVAEIREVDD